MSEEAVGEKKKEDWMNSKWRPMMGWMYMLICTMDMVIFPILWSLLQAMTKTPITQWNPLTLQGAGLFHIAMGAVLGIAAFGRTQEKLNGANNGGIPLPTGSATTPSAPSTGGFGGGFSAPSPAPTSGFGGSGFGSTPSSTPSTAGFGGNPGFGTPAPAPVGVSTGFGGKAAPPAQVDPVL